MESKSDPTLVESFRRSIRKLARSDLRLQTFRKNTYSTDITPLINFEEDYNIKLKEQALAFRGQVPKAKEVAIQIFKIETERRIRIQERNINFHCPDCLFLSEQDDNFVCDKGVDPAKVRECSKFQREDLDSWLQHINNQKGHLAILREILEKEEYLFDFSLLNNEVKF